MVGGQPRCSNYYFIYFMNKVFQKELIVKEQSGSISRVVHVKTNFEHGKFRFFGAYTDKIQICS